MSGVRRNLMRAHAVNIVSKAMELPELGRRAFHLNETAAKIWQLLESRCRLAEISAALPYALSVS